MPVGMIMKSEPYASEICGAAGRVRRRSYSQPARPRLRRPGRPADPGTVPRLRRLVHRAAGAGRRRRHGHRDRARSTAGSGWRSPTPSRSPPGRWWSRPACCRTRTLPAELAGLPADLVTHTRDHHDLDRFKGRRVAVIGAGQSALEIGGAAARERAPTSRSSPGSAKPSAGSSPNPAQLSPLGQHQAAGDPAVRGLALRRSGTRPTAFRLAAGGHADHQGADRARARAAPGG